jgi:Calcineurin-like phosphoesterase
VTGQESEHAGEHDRSTYVVGDVHGHRDEMVAALREAGLVDSDEAWSGGTAQVWFLGDFFDRGPDGLGSLELVMRLADEAEPAGGSVRALLGNHEILALGMYRFGGIDVPSDFGPRSFERSWRLNGGLESDQDRLTERHVEWLCDLPALAIVADHLLMHSDTIEYFGWGQSIEEINAGVREVLASDDIEQWWEGWRRMTARYAFRGGHGHEVADEVMRILGGSRIVHGHSVIADQLGIMPNQIEGPYCYAGGKVLGIDGGVFVGGPCLVVELPWRDSSQGAEGASAFGMQDGARP